MECGITADEFWDLTPREIYNLIKADQNRKEYETKMMLTHAWHIEAFARTKKLPPLERILNSRPKPKVQSGKELINAALGIVAAFGGNIPEDLKKKLNGGV